MKNPASTPVPAPCCRRTTQQQGQALAEGLLVILVASLLWAAIVQIGQLQDMAMQAQHASRVAAFAAAHNTLATDTTAIKQTHFSGAAHQWHTHAGKRLLPKPENIALRVTQNIPLPTQAQPGQADTNATRLRQEWQLEDAGIVRAAVTIPAQITLASQESQELLIRRHTAILRDAGHSLDATSTQQRVAMSATAWADAVRRTQAVGQQVQKLIAPVDAAWHRPAPSYDWLMPWAEDYPGKVTNE